MKYKPKVCERCGQEYCPTSGHQRYCSECSLIMCAETGRTRSAKRRKEHREECLAYNIKWGKANPEKRRMTRAKWNRIHPELRAAWELRRKGKPRARNLIKRRISHSKSKAVHRTLGFLPINQPFNGCEAHHLDHERIVYIPGELHKSISHNGRTGRNMDQINTLALQWLAQNP